ncbi:MAG: hypothetical protein LBT04_10075 [Prevotellaceae bacterium]|jgi:hypothetical protein|nr:hypothetical protein [Prevotellaceae bacterium]
MNKLILISFLLEMLTFGADIKAQDCATLAPPPPSWIFNPTLQSAQADGQTYLLRIFIHIVRNVNGITNIDVNNALTTIPDYLNSSYSSADIQFQLVGFDYIDSEYYNSIDTREKQDALLSTNFHNNAIDIYVVGTNTNTGGAAGRAASIPATALFLHGGYYYQSSLPHEMGHCLGLWHTHHGTVNEGGSDTHQCKELVDGSNGATCGDYISDTPADPIYGMVVNTMVQL